MRELRRWVLAALLCHSGVVYADAPGVFAITGGTVHPVSGPAIANGTVIVRDGLVESVGANLTIPPDATTIDATGMYVYPGLIDAHTSLGLPAARPATPVTPPPAGARAEDPLPETSAAYRALEHLKLVDDDLNARRAVGVTTVLTVPAFGIINGQSAVINLGEGTVESRVIRNPAAIHMSFNPRPTWTFPDSMMGVVAYMRQTMLDARQHLDAHAVYARNPSGLRRPPESPALEALAPVLRRELPVVFVADNDLMMRRAKAIADEFNLRIILSGARQSYKIPGELKAANIPVLVSVRWPVAPSNKEDREEQPLRMIRERQLAPTSPAALARNGVAFALVSGPAKASEFMPGVRKAIDNGLSADDALRALTLSPARILGIDRQLGSLERGKIANVVISDKPIFTKEAKVKRVFIDGREVRLSEIEPKEGAAPSAIDGSWNFSVRTPQGAASIQATLRSEEGRVTGTFSGDRGSGDIRNGSFDGTTLQFAISVAMDGETSDWVFQGTVRESSIEGTVSTNLGTFQFTGSKSQ